MRAVAAALCVAACWTGPAQEAAPPAIMPAAPAHRFSIKLRRTACLGGCPTYTILIHGDGRIEWRGQDHVAAAGQRERRVAPRAIDQLARTVERVRFFELDEYGFLPPKTSCTTVGTTTSCSVDAKWSICSDTSHSIITVMRDGETHEVDVAHCGGRYDADDLEDEILRVSHVDEWIGS